MQPANCEPAILRRSRFVSFDGAVSLETDHQRPDRYRHLECDLAGRKRIARGGGLSYAAASFGSGVVVQDMSAFNRLLSFDPANSTVTVEAGTSLERLLAWALRNDVYFPVLPGYPLITVGGCIAADVHGKNPLRDGTFCDWVEAMTVFHPARGFQKITRSLDPDLFETTCGGFGLTGVIVDATLRMTRLPLKNVLVQRTSVASLAEATERLCGHRQSDFAYTWHDGAARNGAFGQGVLFTGNWTAEPAQDNNRRFSPMSAADRACWPVSLWSRPAVRAANALFRRLAARHPTQVKTAFDAAFPFARQTLYHRFYGRAGLAETQLLVPDAQSQAFVSELSQVVHKMNPPLVMMSMKRFSGHQRSLSISGDGMLFALDLARSASTSRFLAAVDALMLAVGAQPNVSKDSRLPAEMGSRALPFYSRFRERIRAVDHNRLYESELSRRLDL